MATGLPSNPSRELYMARETPILCSKSMLAEEMDDALAHRLFQFKSAVKTVEYR